MKFHSHNSRQNGFTLVETLVAISVLLLAIIGPMTIASRGLQSSQFAKDRITAFYLAQEAIEIARWNRDTGALEGDAFSSSISSYCTDESGTEGCSVRVNNLNSPFRNCDAGVTDPCRITFVEGPLSDTPAFYRHGTEIETKFTRQMWMEEINSHEVEVTAQVTWEDSGVFGGQTQTVEITTYLFDYYDVTP